MFNKVFIFISLGLSLIGTAAGVAQAVDSIKNGDKRAAIAGAACGKTLDELNSKIIVDPKTGKRIKKGILGSEIELD